MNSCVKGVVIDSNADLMAQQIVDNIIVEFCYQDYKKECHGDNDRIAFEKQLKRYTDYVLEFNGIKNNGEISGQEELNNG